MGPIVATNKEKESHTNGSFYCWCSFQKVTATKFLSLTIAPIRSVVRANKNKKTVFHISFFHQNVYNAYKNTFVYSSTVILNTKTSHLIVKLEILTITFGSRRLTWKHNRQIFYASVRYYTTSCAITFFFFYLNCTGFIVPTVNLLVTNSYRDDSTELRWRVTTVCGDEKRQQIWDGIG